MEMAHEGMIWSLAWHPLGHILCSGSNDHTRLDTPTDDLHPAADDLHPPADGVTPVKLTKLLTS